MVASTWNAQPAGHGLPVSGEQRRGRAVEAEEGAGQAALLDVGDGGQVKIGQEVGGEAGAGAAGAHIFDQLGHALGGLRDDEHARRMRMCKAARDDLGVDAPGVVLQFLAQAGAAGGAVHLDGQQARLLAVIVFEHLIGNDGIFQSRHHDAVGWVFGAFLLPVTDGVRDGQVFGLLGPLPEPGREQRARLAVEVIGELEADAVFRVVQHALVPALQLGEIGHAGFGQRISGAERLLLLRVEHLVGDESQHVLDLVQQVVGAASLAVGSGQLVNEVQAGELGARQEAQDFELFVLDVRHGQMR